MSQSPFRRACSQSRHSREESWRWPQRRPAMSEGERGAGYRSAPCWSRTPRHTADNAGADPRNFRGTKERALPETRRAPELFRAAALPSALPARPVGLNVAPPKKKSPARVVKSRGAKRLPVKTGRQDKASVEAKNRCRDRCSGLPGFTAMDLGNSLCSGHRPWRTPSWGSV
jgi:hypothetical protein